MFSNQNKKDEEVVHMNKLHSICSSNDHKLYEMYMYQKNDNNMNEHVNFINKSSNKEISRLENKYVEKIKNVGLIIVSLFHIIQVCMKKEVPPLLII